MISIPVSLLHDTPAHSSSIVNELMTFVACFVVISSQIVHVLNVIEHCSIVAVFCKKRVCLLREGCLEVGIHMMHFGSRSSGLGAQSTDYCTPWKMRRFSIPQRAVWTEYQAVHLQDIFSMYPKLILSLLYFNYFCFQCCGRPSQVSIEHYDMKIAADLLKGKVVNCAGSIPDLKRERTKKTNFKLFL